MGPLKMLIALVESGVFHNHEEAPCPHALERISPEYTQ